MGEGMQRNVEGIQDNVGAMQNSAHGLQADEPGRQARQGRWQSRVLTGLFMLALIGVAVSVELTEVHQRAQVHRRSGCDISEHISCSKVARTSQSEVLGVPISVWGLCTYAAFAFLGGWATVRREHRSWPWGLVGVVSLATVGYSVYLGYVAYFEYHLVCMWCTALYGVNLALFLLSIVALRLAGVGPVQAVKQDLSLLFGHPRLLAGLTVSAALVAGGLVLFYPKAPTNRMRPIKVDFSKNIVVHPRLDEGVGPKSSGQADKGDAASPGMAPDGAGGPSATGTAKDGSAGPIRRADDSKPLKTAVLIGPDTPSRGAVHPDVNIVELTDYECPYCAEAHRNILKALKKYPRRLRLYHRHFPLDKACNRLVTEPFHLHSCAAALAAICAGFQHRFWRMNDMLFEFRNHSKSGLRRLARRVGLDLGSFDSCVTGGKAAAILHDDIELGIKLKAEGTPILVLYGPNLHRTMVNGLVSASLFDDLLKAIDRAKKQAGRLPNKPRGR